VVLASGSIGTVAGLVKAFGAVAGESVDPSQRARILAEGISEAMNCTAFAMVVCSIGMALGLAYWLIRRRQRGEKGRPGERPTSHEP
jgi:biopolymer transport protein ExbB/TolQ